MYRPVVPACGALSVVVRDFPTRTPVRVGVQGPQLTKQGGASGVYTTRPPPERDPVSGPEWSTTTDYRPGITGFDGYSRVGGNKFLTLEGSQGCERPSGMSVTRKCTLK